MIKFVKIESTGNDFILMNNLDSKLKALNQGKIKRLCHRQFGIGADGLILLSPPVPGSKYLFTMTYFNSDGVEVEMCGNGARAITLFASRFSDLNLINGEAYFKTYESECRTTILESRGNEAMVNVIMPPIKDVGAIRPYLGWSQGHDLYLHTGVPHLCLQVDDIKNVDVAGIGKRYRHDNNFANGSNVNFFKLESDGTILVRTYERGVEDETLSCGTGAVAVARAVKEIFKVGNLMTVKYPGGNLHVDLTNDLPQLRGPTTVVFTGEFNLS